MKLGIIIGSTRQGRATETVAKWVTTAAKAIDKFEVSVLDLRDYPMPFFDEPMPPAYNENRQPVAEAQKWLDALATQEAFVFVTPEYNHSMPAVIKNAVDYVDTQLKGKSALIVAHGPSSGGSEAAAHLRTALSNTIGMSVVEPDVLMQTMVSMGGVFDENGALVQSDNDWDAQLEAGLAVLANNE